MIKVLVSIFVLIGAALYYRLSSVGAFRVVSSINDGWNCSRLFEKSLGQGSEDMAIAEDGSFAIISSMSFANVLATSSFSTANGNLFSLDLKTLEITQLLTASKGYAPHGVDVVGSWLFVVVHNDDRHCVEIFTILSATSISLERSVCSPLMVSPNAVAGRADGSFFVVNDHSRSQIAFPYLSLVETVVGLASSSVIHCSDECRPVVTGLPPSAVGIAVRNHLLFVAVPFRSELQVFDETKGYALKRKVKEKNRIQIFIKRSFHRSRLTAQPTT